MLTYHNDVGRTGQNRNETTLTTSNVNSTNFGLLSMIGVDGPVDGEPLYVGSLTISGAIHNTLFVEQRDSVYAFDADSFGQLWHTNKLPVPTKRRPTKWGRLQPSDPDHRHHVDSGDRSCGGSARKVLRVGTTKDPGKLSPATARADLTTGAERTDINSPTAIQATFSGKCLISHNTKNERHCCCFERRDLYGVDLALRHSGLTKPG